MSVELEPGDLGFRRPFNREVSETLYIRNPQENPVVFKVKTTAPKHYCVRPNSGRIEPGQHVEVQVLLQAMKEDPPADAKCKDKFLVQSVAITGALEFSNVVNSIFEKAPKSSIQERKIRVHYLPAEATNGVGPSEEEPPAYPSPGGGAFETPAPTSSKTIDTSTPIPPPNFEKSPKAETPETTRREAAPSSTFEDTPATATETVSKPSGDDAREQLSDALAQIQRLKAQLSEQGLRQRKVEGASSPSTTKGGNTLQQQIAQPAAEMGVPVQIVAALCLLSFLLAYFFF